MKPIISFGDEAKKEQKENDIPFQYEMSDKELKLKKRRVDRFELMLRKKEDLGIIEKCLQMDDLYTPHYTSLNDSNINEISSSDYLKEDVIITNDARKSVPLAFEKITTAQALLIDENPRGTMKAYSPIYKDLNKLQEHIYYENFQQQRKILNAKQYTYELAKYGIAYWREYIKKTYKHQWIEKRDELGQPILKDGKIQYQKKFVYDVNDVVAENLHPNSVVLDNKCYGVKDVNRPARDCFIFEYYSQDDFNDVYPVQVYDKAQHVKCGQGWMLEDKSYNKSEMEVADRERKPIQCIIYENKKQGFIEKWANGIRIDISPLPGGELSINGGKWIQDKNNYDGIGVGQIINLYQPIIDDIKNASLERLRQIVRPHEDFFNGAHVSDESDDVFYGAGNQRKIEGSKDDIVFTRPPTKTQAEMAEEEQVNEEVDRATAIPRNLAGTDDAKTAYQSMQNRESALRKLSLPLSTIKSTIEDAANLDLALYQIAYSIPEETQIYQQGQPEYDEALSIYQDNPDDERVVPMDMDEEGNVSKVARRKFKTMELNLSMELKDMKPTGRVVEADESDFWEMIPKHFNWKGRIEIIAKSFLPISKAMEDEMDKALMNQLMTVETTDEMGQPTLKDANGQPYTIDKVKVLKTLVDISEKYNSKDFVVPLTPQNINNDNTGGSPLDNQDQITSKSIMGLKQPGVAQPEALSK